MIWWLVTRLLYIVKDDCDLLRMAMGRFQHSFELVQILSTSSHFFVLHRPNHPANVLQIQAIHELSFLTN